MVIFIDYQNAYMRAREVFYSRDHPHPRGQFRPLPLARLIVGKNGAGRSLSQVRVYCGMPSNARDPRGYAARRRQVANWARDPLVEVMTRPLRYPRDYPRSQPEEKGIDVQLAVDFITMALNGEYDVGIIMSEDTDLRPALEGVLKLQAKAPVSVEVAAWDPRLGARRGLKVPGRTIPCHYISWAEYRSVEDPANYAQP